MKMFVTAIFDQPKKLGHFPQPIGYASSPREFGRIHFVTASSVDRIHEESDEAFVKRGISVRAVTLMNNVGFATLVAQRESSGTPERSKVDNHN